MRIIAGKETRAKLTSIGKAFVNFWNYSSIITRVKQVGKEYGIKVKPVNEANTSKTCFLCGEIHENGRIKRGLFQCPHTEKVINADLNGAINMMKHGPMRVSG